MQIVVILIIALVFLADEAAEWSPWRPFTDPWLQATAGVWLLAVLAFASVVALDLCRRRLEHRGSRGAVVSADRIVTVTLWTVPLAHAVNVILFDWVGAVRALIGDHILLDEAVAMSAPLAVILAAWWGYYPINRRLREAALIRQLDTGQPIYPIWTRGQYVIAQARVNLALLVVPALLIIGWGEAVEAAWPAEGGVVSGEWVRHAAMFIGAGGVFLCAPALMRAIWDTTPLAPGELRDRLVRLSRVHRVPVREVLVWNTNGGMINGAITGLIGRLRYILLTDALLDTMTQRQIEAVMAHELGHARRHHLPWLAISLLAIFSATGMTVAWLIETARAWRTEETVLAGWAAWLQQFTAPVAPSDFVAQWTEPVGIALTFVTAMIVFGWVSRRFERQADTFAVQHLSGMTRRRGREAPITHPAVEAMCEALDVVADLNHIRRERHSWRHGSIEWRQGYLRSLVGRPCGSLSIDREIALIKATALLVGLAAIAAGWWMRLG